MNSKRFHLKDAPEIGPADTADPRKARERKIKMIAYIALTVVVGGGTLWLILQGTGAINVSIGDNSLTIPGIYGTTVYFNEIHGVQLEDMSMAEIGAGRRRAGATTPNNWRGNFDAGLLNVQNPQEGPTIRISRINDRPLYISLQYAADTRALYQDIVAAIR